MATACVFCGASGTMTKEHVLPDWLERIGLTGQPAAAGSGWLNRSSEYRQTSRPFQTTVKAVCATSVWPTCWASSCCPGSATGRT